MYFSILSLILAAGPANALEIASAHPDAPAPAVPPGRAVRRAVGRRAVAAAGAGGGSAVLLDADALARAVADDGPAPPVRAAAPAGAAPPGDAGRPPALRAVALGAAAAAADRGAEVPQDGAANAAAAANVDAAADTHALLRDAADVGPAPGARFAAAKAVVNLPNANLKNSPNNTTWNDDSPDTDESQGEIVSNSSIIAFQGESMTFMKDRNGGDMKSTPLYYATLNFDAEHTTTDLLHVNFYSSSDTNLRIVSTNLSKNGNKVRHEYVTEEQDQYVARVDLTADGNGKHIIDWAHLQVLFEIDDPSYRASGRLEGVKVEQPFCMSNDPGNWEGVPCYARAEFVIFGEERGLYVWKATPCSCIPCGQSVPHDYGGGACAAATSTNNEKVCDVPWGCYSSVGATCDCGSHHTI